MAMAALGTKAAGSAVYLLISGTNTKFYVVNQGAPGGSSLYGNFASGTVLLSANCLSSAIWNRTGEDRYAASSIHAYLNGNSFLSLFEASIQAQIRAVTIPVKQGKYAPVTSISAKGFLPSSKEMGVALNTDGDGAAFAYRPWPDAAFAGTNYWWSRTPDIGLEGGNIRAFYYSMAGDDTLYCAYSAGVRPCIVLPDTLLVRDDGTVTTNMPPSTPPGITIPTAVQGGSVIAVSWAASADAEGNLAGYKVEKSTGGAWSQVYQGEALTTQDAVAYGASTVAYRVKAYDTEGLESAWQTSPTRTVVNNTAPVAPSGMTIPTLVTGGAPLTVAWAASADAEGNLAGYTLERSIDGGTAWSQVYQGPGRSYTDQITRGWPTVKYRVKAYDAFSLQSGWRESEARAVDNSVAPAISSDTSGDIGLKSAGFSWAYTVSQQDGETTAVVEKIDGVTVRSYTATLGVENTFDVSGMTFMTLLNGGHAVQVIATAVNGKSAAYSVTFTKGVYALSVTLAAPIESDEPILKMVMRVVGLIPADAAYNVLVTNNGLDDAPVWEDATEEVKAGQTHVFANQTAIHGHAMNFLITASRGASNTGGYISAISAVGGTTFFGSLPGVIRTVNEYPPDDNGNLELTPEKVGAVPTTRTVNSKSLAANITLIASDVSAVPTTRTVNGKALSADITLAAGDVGAIPTSEKAGLLPESGGDGNLSYVKYPDGTLIQKRIFHIAPGILTFNQKTTELYMAEAPYTILGDYLIPFVGGPVCSYFPLYNGGSSDIWIGVGYITTGFDATTDWWPFSIWSVYSGNSTLTVNVAGIAIGRWK